MLITRQFPPIAFSAFFSPKELGFQVHSKPNFERLILKFREDRFVHAMFSNCSTACSKHFVQVSAPSFYALRISSNLTVFINFVQRLPVSINFCTPITVISFISLITCYATTHPGNTRNLTNDRVYESVEIGGIK